VGTTQYVDAFQRANFWAVEDRSIFHVNLNPVQALKPVVVNVPAANGLALKASAYGGCASLGIIDINWFDAYVQNTLLPALGFNPSQFPVFFVHNVVWAGDVDDLNQCCILGYHNATGLPMKTYSVSNFDSTGVFGTTARDTGVLSHEIGEWMNDPFVSNPTPAWGHIGQVGGCQNNLEVGDPLSGTGVSPVVMGNNFTYHLQELAFFSWFYGQNLAAGPGAPASLGINGWFSNNGTFLNNAGPPCQ
jgi:hypothetical protein